MSNILQVNSEGKTLYAICAERYIIRNRQQIVIPTVIHCHAAHEGEARWIFGQDPDHKGFKIIAVAPVVGYFVDDEHGDKLST